MNTLRSSSKQILLIAFITFFIVVCPVISFGCGSNSFQKWSSSQVIDAFKNSGLSVEGARTISKSDCGSMINNYTEGTFFTIPADANVKLGGCLYSFESEEQFETARSAVLAKEMNTLQYISTTEGNIIFTLPFDHKYDKINAKYTASLNAMGSTGETNQDFKRWDSNQAIDVLKSAGVKIEATRLNRPGFTGGSFV